ncbi:MAG TPA: hypothetical protein VF995_04480 [Actinomycetota bacterium]
MPSLDDGLLAQLDILIDLAADRGGLLLDRDERLARSETSLLASALGLDPIPAGPRSSAPAVEAPPRFGDDAVELLRSLAESVGILREHAGRLEVTSLYGAWRRIALQLRAGLVYASWCHRVHWPNLVANGDDLAAEQLAHRRIRVLRLLFDLPAGVAVTLTGLADTVADATGLPAGPWLCSALTAVFLDPLVALGVAQLEPDSLRPPTTLHLGPLARTVIGSALVAAGEEVPLAPAGAN